MIAANKIVAASLLCLATFTADAPLPLFNDPVDISGDFRTLENICFLADKVAEFDHVTHSGKLFYQRAQYRVRHAFDYDLSFIWACAAWAGRQCYPLHWDGAAESTDDGMAAELRGGLSFCLSDFPFRSHDVSGFTATAKGLIFLPGETAAHELTLTKSGHGFKLDNDPLAGKVTWKISAAKNENE